MAECIDCRKECGEDNIVMLITLAGQTWGVRCSECQTEKEDDWVCG